MPSPLGEGQTVTPINRHQQGEVPCGRFTGEGARRAGGAHWHSARDRFSSLNRRDKSLPQFVKVG